MSALTPTIGIRWRIQRFAHSIEQKFRDHQLLSEADGEQMADFRKALGLTRSRLAKICHTSARTIENVETGTSNNPDTIERYFNSMLAFIDSLSAAENPIPPWLDLPIGTWNEDMDTLCGLLDPEMRAVPFHGHSRQKLRNELIEWSNSDRPVLIRSLRADAGMGKTRLAVELCRDLVGMGSGKLNTDWCAGFVRPEHFPTNQSVWSTGDFSNRKVLLVFDYAGGSHALPIIKRLLPFLVDPPTAKLRVLFLDRVDYWLSELRREKHYQDLDRRHGVSRGFAVTEMGDAYDGLGRNAVFESAFGVFRDKLQSKRAGFAPDDLDKPLFDRVLMLHMRALLEADGATGSDKERELLEECLHREERQWQRRMAAHGIKSHLFGLVKRAYSNISAEGGATSVSDARAIALQDKAFASLPAYLQDSLLKILHECYASSSRYIEPLRPDLLGEYFISKPTRR